jgi:hypothetical protein
MWRWRFKEVLVLVFRLEVSPTALFQRQAHKSVKLAAAAEKERRQEKVLDKIAGERPPPSRSKLGLGICQRLLLSCPCLCTYTPIS